MSLAEEYRRLAEEAERKVADYTEQVGVLERRIQWLKQYAPMDAECKTAINDARAELSDLKRELDAAQITAQAARAVVP